MFLPLMDLSFRRVRERERERERERGRGLHRVRRDVVDLSPGLGGRRSERGPSVVPVRPRSFVGKREREREREREGREREREIDGVG